MSDYGGKIAKSNTTSLGSNLKNLLLQSSFPLLKIKTIGEGSITYTHDGASNDITITTHGLGYKPLFRVLTQWWDIDSGAKQTTFRNAPFIDTLLDGAVYFDARPYVNSEELRYAVSSFDGVGSQSVTLNFIYAIYYEVGEDT